MLHGIRHGSREMSTLLWWKELQAKHQAIVTMGELHHIVVDVYQSEICCRIMCVDTLEQVLISYATFRCHKTRVQFFLCWNLEILSCLFEMAHFAHAWLFLLRVTKVEHCGQRSRRRTRVEHAESQRWRRDRAAPLLILPTCAVSLTPEYVLKFTISLRWWPITAADVWSFCYRYYLQLSENMRLHLSCVPGAASLPQDFALSSIFTISTPVPDTFQWIWPPRDLSTHDAVAMEG